MVEQNNESMKTAFTVSIDAAEKCSFWFFFLKKYFVVSKNTINFADMKETYDVMYSNRCSSAREGSSPDRATTKKQINVKD